MASDATHLKLLITAGPTHEPIDAVRYIGNRSSGRVGIAIAQAACERGRDVTLLLGPIRDATLLSTLPSNCNVVRFETTAQLQTCLQEHFPKCDQLVMAAAVADYTPVEPIVGKKPREQDKKAIWTLTLKPTPDLVAELASTKQSHQRIVAFALEEASQLLQRATQKMRRKCVDAIVANPLETMDAADITATWITADGTQNAANAMSKSDFAHWLLDQMATL